MTRLAYTAEQKAEATSMALRLGVAVAAGALGINRNSIRSWVTRRQHGLPLDATPKVHPRHPANERPEAPPLPDGVTLVDESGAIRTPRSLYISVAPAKGFWLEDRSFTTTAVGARRKHTDSWHHRPVAAFAIVERVNVGLDEPPWRECVALCIGYGPDNEALLEECVHESDLTCIGPHGCTGHVEVLVKTVKEITDPA
jgi:transposase-like protein